MNSQARDPAHACPMCQGRNTVKAVEWLLTEIHVCHDCHQTFIVEKPPRPSLPFPSTKGT
jgi:ribosomal protein L37AE/L43A